MSFSDSHDHIKPSQDAQGFRIDKYLCVKFENELIYDQLDPVDRYIQQLLLW